MRGRPDRFRLRRGSGVGRLILGSFSGRLRVEPKAMAIFTKDSILTAYGAKQTGSIDTRGGSVRAAYNASSVLGDYNEMVLLSP